MAVYRDLYSGGNYLIHYKISNILNVVYLTCLYGIGMPILFPIAAFNFLNQYVCERYIVAYLMKQPPALDDKLTKNALEVMKYAPFLMLFNGYWMLSNPQIFQNVTSPIQDSTESMASNHFFGFHVNRNLPILLMCMASVFLLVVQKQFPRQLMRLGFTL